MLKIMMAAAGAMALAAPGLALAGPAGDWHHEGMGILHGLSLTDTQKDQVHQIEQGGERQMKASYDQARALHDQMSAAVLSGAPMEQLLPILRQQEILREQVDSERLALIVQVRNTLTASQLSQASSQHAKLAALRQQEHEVMSGSASQ